jgi:hypothetical protein
MYKPMDIVNLPEDFSTFVREWPAKAIVDLIWPLGVGPRVSSTRVVMGRKSSSNEVNRADRSPLLLPLCHIQSVGPGMGEYLLLETYEHHRPGYEVLKAGTAFRMYTMDIHLHEIHLHETHSKTSTDNDWPWINHLRQSADMRWATGLDREFRRAL